MTDTRHKNLSWNLGGRDRNGQLEWVQVKCAILLDIRDELQTLNRLLACQNFIVMPATLRSIQRNTAKPKKRTA